MFSTHYTTYSFAVVTLAGLSIVQVSVEFQQKDAEVPEEIVEEKETVTKKTSPKSSKKEKQSQKKHSGMILNNF